MQTLLRLCESLPGKCHSGQIGSGRPQDYAKSLYWLWQLHTGMLTRSHNVSRLKRGNDGDDKIGNFRYCFS